jgi:2-amino-4-hydroxy-6-hydroxymethyldihydropteridine diphosphokinase
LNSTASVSAGPPVEVLLALGSNLGDRQRQLERAVARLAWVGELRAVSALYQTEPVGYEDQGVFLNAAVRLLTWLGVQRLFVWCKGLEFAAGRRPGLPMGPRPLDIDIVLYGSQAVCTPRVVVPHPRFAERPFMLAPLADIAAETVAPGLPESIGVLDRRLGRPGVVRVADPGAWWDGRADPAP